ncbi:MAG: heavy-metal-associated domain-containing protein [Clostridia bacterium]|nr:heavy-metal-associated domain-containing protein [Clostridia bacterium]
MLFGKKEEAVTTLSIEGMMCPRCVAHVQEALSAVKGVSSVEVSLEEKSATVTGKASLDALKDAVTRAGYEVK